MPILFQYLLKVSISLAIMYIFYQLVLRRLTFYSHNRWYLLGYSVLCYFISFINIGPILQKSVGEGYELFNKVPSVGTLATGLSAGPATTETAAGWSAWNWLTLVLVAGAVVLIARLVIQLVSFNRLKAGAKLISGAGIKFYQVNRNIIPFSFGNSIYINQNLHTESELKEIIRHEFVHVRQRHTVDIIWGELLCIMNWYNPFAWLIRRAMRQNLEFIADNKVIANGVDKKEYQYLLLKVIGNNHFSIASQFNFTSLKKRIVMMNKIKSAKVHLLKFLFILPLLAVLLLAFRDKLNNRSEEGVFYLSGLTLDAKTEKPLNGVVVKESASGQQAVSDDKGYFRISLPAAAMKSKPLFSFLLDGYTTSPLTKNIPLGSLQEGKISNIEFVYMTPGGSDASSHAHSEYYAGEPDFDIVMKRFETHRKGIDRLAKVESLVANSKKPIWVIDGIPYAISWGGSKAWFDKSEIGESLEFKVWVDGKIMTMDEVNTTINRSQVLGVGASSKAASLVNYGVSDNLLLLNLVSKRGDWTIVDTVPVASGQPGKLHTSYSLHRDDDMSEEHKRFFKRNANVNLLHWKRDGSLEVYLADGKVQKFGTPGDFEKFESEYGNLPSPAGSTATIAAPVSPVAPASPGSPVVSPVSPVSPLSPTAPASQPAPAGPVKTRINITSAIKADVTERPLIIVGGEEWPAHLDMNLIDPGRIEKVSVLKGESAISKYGNKAKDGVIVIDTKKQTGEQYRSLTSQGQPAFYLNGKKISRQSVDLLDPAKIKSIEVLKGPKAIEKYGDDGKNGAVEITIPLQTDGMKYTEKPVTQAWDIQNILPGKKKDGC